MNKHATCHGCPDRTLSCRTNCAGWQAREQAKEVEYARRKAALASFPEHANQLKQADRWRKMKARGLA